MLAAADSAPERCFLHGVVSQFVLCAWPRSNWFLSFLLTNVVGSCQTPWRDCVYGFSPHLGLLLRCSPVRSFFTHLFGASGLLTHRRLRSILHSTCCKTASTVRFCWCLLTSAVFSLPPTALECTHQGGCAWQVYSSMCKKLVIYIFGKLAMEKKNVNVFFPVPAYFAFSPHVSWRLE